MPTYSGHLWLVDPRWLSVAWVYEYPSMPELFASCYISVFIHVRVVRLNWVTPPAHALLLILGMFSLYLLKALIVAIWNPAKFLVGEANLAQFLHCPLQSQCLILEKAVPQVSVSISD